MNARDLVEILDDLDPNTEVRIATQPAWPFEYSLSGRIADNATDTADTDEAPVVWLAVGEQLDYLPGYVAEQIGWSSAT